MNDTTTATVSTPPVQYAFYLGFTEGQADAIMEGLPLGHRAGAAMRDLFLRLRAARRGQPREQATAQASEDTLETFVQLARKAPEQQPVRGLIVGKKDVTGVSGVGVIGEFCIFSDGKTAIRWLGGPPQNQPRFEVYDNPTMAPFIQISGHNGNTEIVWIDDPGPWA